MWKSNMWTVIRCLICVFYIPFKNPHSSSPSYPSTPRAPFISDNPILSPAVKALLIVHYLSVSAQRSRDRILIQTVSPPSPESDALIKALKTQKSATYQNCIWIEPLSLSTVGRRWYQTAAHGQLQFHGGCNDLQRYLSKLCHAFLIIELQVTMEMHSLIFLRVKYKDIHVRLFMNVKWKVPSPWTPLNANSPRNWTIKPS